MVFYQYWGGGTSPIGKRLIYFHFFLLKASLKCQIRAQCGDGILSVPSPQIQKTIFLIGFPLNLSQGLAQVVSGY